MICSLRPGELDLLVLPEMCLTGYLHITAESIVPYLEHPKTGPTSVLAAELAKRLQCYVVAGYAEILSELHKAAQVVDGQGSEENHEVGYTSAMVVGPDGDIFGNYRKTYLFAADKCWAKAGRHIRMRRELI